MNEIKNRTIMQGDVLEQMALIPDNSVDVGVSSPPYWGLRDYGVEGQWGLEKDFRDYLKKMDELMKQMKRILKPTASCWINLGDTYSGGNAHSDWSGSDENFDQKRQESGQFSSILKNHIAAKSRYGIPERFYINCIDNGWIARNHIPWYKENAMPSSVKDRFTNKWESIFFLVKKQHYYFNLDAVREKPKTGSYKQFNRRIRDAKRLEQMDLLGAIPGAVMTEDENLNTDSNGARKELSVPGQSTQGIHRRRAEGLSDWAGLDKKPKQDSTLGADGKPKPTYDGFNERWNNSVNPGPYTGEGPEGKWREHYDPDGNCLGCKQHWTKHTVSDKQKEGMGGAASRAESIVWCNAAGKNPGDFWQYEVTEGLPPSQMSKLQRTAYARNVLGLDHDSCLNNPNGKNPGDVFFINPRPFVAAHFATFPEELPLKILKCACPQQVCRQCGKPREPIVKSDNPSKEFADYENDMDFANTNQVTSNPQSSQSLHRNGEGVYSTAKVTGWTDCGCGVGFRPGIAFDPFFGAGTVGVAAEQLGLHWLGIEINKDYIGIAKKRLEPYMNQSILDFL